MESSDQEKALEVLTEQYKNVVTLLQKLGKETKETQKEFLKFVNVADDFRIKVGGWVNLGKHADELDKLASAAENKYKK